MSVAPSADCQGGQRSAWADHWTRKGSPLAQCLSFYRMRICAPIVRDDVARYMPDSGRFIEAGSGTAETSSLVNKHGGRVKLIALDYVPAVLATKHPVADIAVAANLFAMPFADASVDGIWNVGVLEHYTHAEIDRAFQEFRRVLRPGGRVVVFWPATNSIPQKFLVGGAAIVGLLTGRGASYRFHPPEISQLHSIAEGREILERNGFRFVAVTGGLKSLLAWKTVVGQKP